MAVKSLFEIAVPVRDNAGATVPHGRHAAFESLILSECGGYTVMPDTDGAWRDESTGVTYFDRMRAYRVACYEDDMRRLVAAAAKIYSDQAAFFVAELGRAWIVSRGLAESPNQLWRYTRTAGALSEVGNETD